MVTCLGGLVLLPLSVPPSQEIFPRYLNLKNTVGRTKQTVQVLSAPHEPGTHESESLQRLDTVQLGTRRSDVSQSGGMY